MASQDDWRIVIPGDELKAAPGASAKRMARLSFAEQPVRSIMGRLKRAHTEERAWRKGAAGERSVGRLLEKLPKDEWKVLHDVPVGSNGRNIDHLVIGTRGVYTINTKNLSGKVKVLSRVLYVNGHPTTYLGAAALEARDASKRLTAALGKPVNVVPMVLLICEELQVKEWPKDVIVNRRRLGIDWLKRQPKVMPLAEAARIGRAAATSSTWA